MANKSDKLTQRTQRQTVAKLIQLANTADPAERRRMAEQLFDVLGITEDNRVYGIDIERTRPGRKSGKIVLSDDDQQRVFAALLAANELLERYEERITEAERHKHQITPGVHPSFFSGQLDILVTVFTDLGALVLEAAGVQSC